MPLSEKLNIPSSSPATDSRSSTSSCPPNLEERQTQGPAKERLSLQLDFEKDGAPVGSTTDAVRTHPHVLFSPVHYEPGYSYPLLVWLHGRGGDERQVMRVMPVLSMRNYVAVAPQGWKSPTDEPVDSPDLAYQADRRNLDVLAILQKGRRAKAFYDWPETDDALAETEQRLFDCISIARQRNNIAPDRIFLAGFGSGGTMALRIGLLWPERFAGVASLGGPLPDRGRVLPRWSAARSTSVFLGVGQESEEFSPDTACQALELFHTAGVSVTVRDYPCGQTLAPQMLQDLNRWMMGLVCS